MGDQINAYYKYDTSNLSQVEEEYDGFLNAPQLTQLPLATELGNHDCGYNTALYGQHFTLPNISESTVRSAAMPMAITLWILSLPVTATTTLLTTTPCIWC